VVKTAERIVGVLLSPLGRFTKAANTEGSVLFRAPLIPLSVSFLSCRQEGDSGASERGLQKSFFPFAVGLLNTK